jgi:hypothetical protein
MLLLLLLLLLLVLLVLLAVAVVVVVVGAIAVAVVGYFWPSFTLLLYLFLSSIYIDLKHLFRFHF